MHACIETLQEFARDVIVAEYMFGEAQHRKRVVVQVRRPLDDFGKQLFIYALRRNIRECSLFIPVISATTEGRLEGFFRREWKWAEDRSLDMAHDVAFILPVVIDDTPAYSPGVPPRFSELQWTHLPGGEPTEAFRARLVQLVRAARKRERA